MLHDSLDPGKVCRPPIEWNALQATPVEDEIEAAITERQLGCVADKEVGRRIPSISRGDGLTNCRKGKVGSDNKGEIPGQLDGQTARSTAEIDRAASDNVGALEQRLDLTWQIIDLPDGIATHIGLISAFPL